MVNMKLLFLCVCVCEKKVGELAEWVAYWIQALLSKFKHFFNSRISLNRINRGTMLQIYKLLIHDLQ